MIGCTSTVSELYDSERFCGRVLVVSWPQLQGGAGSRGIDVFRSPKSIGDELGSSLICMEFTSHGRLPTWPAPGSVHQIEFCPGPTAIPSGADLLVGSVYCVIDPEGVMRPSTLAVYSVNQRLPSGPVTIP